MEFLSVFSSYMIALLRIPFLASLFILSAIQQILFDRGEVVNVEMKIAPLRCDRKKVSDNVAYIDKLCCENPDLAEIVDENIDEEEEE